MSSLRFILIALAAVLALARPGSSTEPGVFDTRAGIGMRLSLSEPVPWRVYTLSAPPRLVVDLATDGAVEGLVDRAERALDVRKGAIVPGWTRVVVDLSGPFGVQSASLDSMTSSLRVDLELLSPEAFLARSGAPKAARAFPERPPARPAAPDDGRLRVVLDPGHGGLDPGAEAGGLQEAALMLTFARELRPILEAAGFHVSLTREDDSFVPLEARVTMARRFGADVFVSLHADALPEGHASGATVYTLADEASDRASRLLAERHDQSDLLAGVDLAGQGDEIALVLMDLARRETAPKARRLAETVVRSLRDATGHVNARPHRQAAFSGLKAPDIPSILIELGFLSSKADRDRLGDATWRASAAIALRDALADWVETEAQNVSARLGE